MKRKWTHLHKNKGGWPRINPDLDALILRLAQENTSWGYGNIAGGLIKLGIILSESTVRSVLNRRGIVPARVLAGSMGRRHLMNHYRSQLLACDFLTVETLFLKTLYLDFFDSEGLNWSIA